MTSLSHPELLLRILTAFLAGFVVGWERESHGRPAGLRTTILACVAAAVAMILSEILYVQSGTAPTAAWRPDPARLGAGLLTGIGFLGAGTIIRHTNMVRGVTTAASLWFVTILGLAFGSGEYFLGLVGVGVAWLTLYVLPMFEQHIETTWHATLTVRTTLDAISDEQLRSHIEALGPKVTGIRLNHNLEKKEKTFTCELKTKNTRVFESARELIASLSLRDGVLQVEWS